MAHATAEQGSWYSMDESGKVNWISQTPTTDLEFDIAWSVAPASVSGDVHIVEGWDASLDMVRDQEVASSPSADLMRDLRTGTFYDRSLNITPLSRYTETGERPATLRFEAEHAHNEYAGNTGTPVDVYTG